MFSFCTYFDRNYLPQALSLYNSLEKSCPDFMLYTICLDDDSYQILSILTYPKMTLIKLAEIELKYPDLLFAKSNRSKVEYYFTLSPAMPLYIFEVYSPKLLTYLDADLFFFSDPKPIFEEMGSCSIAIIEHKLHSYFSSMFVYGRFNVGWISFRNDEEGMACLKYWNQQCLEWCYKRLENGKFADQKYLDYWPNLYKNLKIINHKGANVAPWNLGNYNVKMRGDSILIDEQVLIFFHFHGLKKYLPNIYSVGYRITKVNHVSRLKIYNTYITNLLENSRMVNTIIKKNQLQIPLLERKDVFTDTNFIEKIKQFGSLLFRVFFSGNYVIHKSHD